MRGNEGEKEHEVKDFLGVGVLAKQTEEAEKEDAAAMVAV